MIAYKDKYVFQWVWWWQFPSFKKWEFPRKPSGYYDYTEKPIFWAYYFGIFEIRIFPGKWY